MSECRCSRPTRDAAYVCDDCAARLTQALAEIPWLLDELETTVSNQRGVDYRTRGGTPSSEKPMPYHAAASESREKLRGVLVEWVKFCRDEHVRNQAPTQGTPANDVLALSRWLLWRVDGLGLTELGPDAVDEITGAVSACRRLIDRRPDRQYLGDCGCGEGRLYAFGGASMARCSSCGEQVEADKLREGLLAQLDDRLCTATEIAHLSTYLGLNADRTTVRNRIAKWHQRGRITSETLFTEPAFRFGIIWRLLLHDESENKS